MPIDKTTLNRIRIAIQHALCSCVEDNDDDVNYESMAKAAVDLGIIEKEEDFDGETFTHAPILFEKIWERIGDDLYKTPLDLFNAWIEDDISIYRLGEEIEDWSEVQLECSMLQVILSGRNPIANFVFVGKDFVKLYKDRLSDASKNAAEIFCHATDGTYTEFNQYAAELGGYPGTKLIFSLPHIVKCAMRNLIHITKLSGISVNEPLLVYAVYKKMYENNKLPYSYGDIVYDIIDSMVTLKEEGMIQ